VRAGARRGERVAGAAVEGGLELERLHAELLDREALEDALRVVGAVVLADARVVAADDQLVDAVVLAHERVKERLARAGVAHRGREGREQRALARVVAAHQLLVGREANARRDVVPLRLADERVQHEAVRLLERELGEVLVRAVDRVARLEAGDLAPAPLGDRRAQLARREAEARERQVLGQRQHRDAPADERARPGHQVRDAGVGGVVRAVHLARLLERVAREDVLDLDHTPEPAARVVERRGRARVQALVVGGEREGQRPHGAVGEPERVDDARVVGGAQEAFERARRARRDQLEVGLLARVERDPRQAGGAGAKRLRVGAGHDAVHEGAPVRADEGGLGE
jgi:hypothetical protein